MSEITELLAAEAMRQQPTRQPPFAELVRRRGRRRRWRTGWRVSAVAGLVVLGGFTARVVTGPPGEAVVTGSMVWFARIPQPAETGPPRMRPFGTAGVVRLQAADGRLLVVKTDDDGRFSLTVPPGEYTVLGWPDSFGASSPPDPQHDPSWGVAAAVAAGSAPGSTAPCRADAPVVVPAGGRAGVDVICHG
ncbi:hypothetical protein [Dactylosporangium sp. NPDC051541]|uniref:hypothetical protein n=1 Tax=Dactylosporangium sp. NPDC051541 TaxID=3363977 RepID=UPI0037B04A19